MRQLGAYDLPATNTLKDQLYANWARHMGLLPHERETVRFIINGYTDKETAQELNLSYRTVNCYTKRIYAKLGIHDRFKLMGSFIDYIVYNSGINP
jgi:DNA-binding NarL/FixJ family response regulator